MRIKTAESFSDSDSLLNFSIPRKSDSSTFLEFPEFDLWEKIWQKKFDRVGGGLGSPGSRVASTMPFKQKFIDYNVKPFDTGNLFQSEVLKFNM